MNLFLLLAIMIGTALEPVPLADPARLGTRMLAVALGILFVGLMAAAFALTTIRGVERGGFTRARLLTRYRRQQWFIEAASLLVYAVIIHRIQWGSMIGMCCAWADWPVIRELLLLTPYLCMSALALVGSVWVEHWARRGAPERTWTKVYSFQWRHRHGILLASLMVSMALKGVATWWFPGLESNAWASLAFLGVMVMTLMVIAPLILRNVWRAVPMATGPARRALESLGRSLGFRYANILVWRTEHSMANAAVTGLVPQLRYVLFSDVLVEQLTPAELAAVFGHEVGHIRHHHLAYYFAFVVGSILAISLFSGFVEQSLLALLDPSFARAARSVFGYVPLEVLLLIPYFAFVFGHLSRRLERQADLFGARAASRAVLDLEHEMGLADRRGAPSGSLPLLADGIRIFIDALVKVANLNGVPMGTWSWRHGSIEQRIRFLEQVQADPSLATRTDRQVLLLRVALAAILAAGIAWLAPGARWGL